MVVLAEHAHRNADAAIGYMDDSDAWLSDISFRLGQLHQRACRVARPDPAELSRRLVDLELTSELDAFHRAAASYEDVLGKAGIAEYRRLVEPRWRAAGPTQAVDAVDRAQRILELRERYRAAASTLPSTNVTALADLVCERPILTARLVTERLK